MQFQSIVVLFSFALAATAVPANPKKTKQCSQTQKTACCQDINKQLIGINCVAVDLVSGGQCSADQQLACCEAPNGVIAVGPVCPQVIVL